MTECFYFKMNEEKPNEWNKKFSLQNIFAYFCLFYNLIMSNYVWKVGEIALAKLSQKVYAKVRVAKNEDGIFHDEKGIE